METERPSPRFVDIDRWEPRDVLEAMIGGQFAAVAAVRSALPAIEAAAAAMEPRLSRGGRIIYAGAGTSGRLAVQDGAELMPTFAWPRERLLLLIAGGDEAMTRAVEGAEDAAEQAAQKIGLHGVNAADNLVAVAASGTTPFTLGCLREAKRRGAHTIGMANNAGAPLLQEAEAPIFLDSGAEPIAGSTRMNAGTSQRIALTMLSTLVMIRLGRVYRGTMIEVQATNAKLKQRKQRMLRYLTGCHSADGERALERARGSVKLAILLLRGCNLRQAERLLQETNGHLRRAIERFDADENRN
jgi:N-acetylmuramic acid 6-phosphate etherase